MSKKNKEKKKDKQKKHGGSRSGRLSPAKRVLVTGIALVLVALSACVIFDVNENYSLDELGKLFADMHSQRQAEPVSTQPVSSADGQQEEQISWSGWQAGAVSADDAQLLASPEETAAPVAQPAAGARLVALRQENSWLYVRCGSRLGWLKADDAQLEGEPVELEASEPLEPTSLNGTKHQKRLDALSHYYGCVGVQLAVIKNGEVSYTYEYGWADRGEKLAMNADTKIRVASLTKVFVAMNALAMRDMGQVELDKDVSDYLGVTVRNPRYPNDVITLRQLLTHTSSLTDFGVNGKESNSLYDRIVNGKNYLTAQPGSAEAWKYNNSGMCAAGAALEKASGETLVDYSERYFFQPLGLDASLWAGRIKDKANIAALYKMGERYFTQQNQLDRPYYETPGENFCLYAGDLTISAQDLAKLVCILIGNGCYNGVYYLSPESVEELQGEVCPASKHVQCLTICRYDDQINGRDLFYHTGNAYGVLSYMSYDEATGDGIVVITTGAEDIDAKSRAVYLGCKDIAEYCYGTVLAE